MFSIDSALPGYISFAIALLVYAGVLRTTLNPEVRHRAAAFLTSLYAFFALLIHGLEAAWRANLLSSLSPFLLEQFHWYSALALSFFLLIVLHAFLQKKLSPVWIVMGVLWAASIPAVLLNIFNLPDILWTNDIWMLPRERLGFAISALGWLVFGTGMIFTFRVAYRNTKQPLHRNRLAYWLPILFFMLTADALFINNLALWAAPLRMVGTVVLSYIVITHYLPDLQQIMRSMLIYVATTLLASLFYLAGFAGATALFPNIAASNTIIVGTIVAVLLASIYRTLLGFVERRVDKLLRIEHLDVSHTINEYSRSISNILEMERLANVTITLIMEVMDIQRGFLFLVDKKQTNDGQQFYGLRAVRSAGERPISEIWLRQDGPIVKHFLEEQRPLLQFDVDLLPKFKTNFPDERSRLNRLDAEVYVPIFAKREWIGLFALGGKISGNRYTEENLVTLSALAGQTAVALENARLVENLIELNKKVRDAYRDLGHAKQDLEKIDRTKSDFISIASHELRTPLTVMRGYTEMLLDSPDLNQHVLKMLKGIHDGTMRLHEIMESLFDIAQLDARTLELEFEPIDVGKLVQEVSTGMSQVLKDRKQTLTLDLPPLPGIQADPNTLRKVFYHLVTNAVKFTPDEGKIKITGKTLPFSNADMPEGGLEIIVSDTGIGIDASFKEVIFTKFYQPGEQLGKHSTGKTKFKGSGVGLGLALSRGIIEAHGGKIWVESPGYDEAKCLGSKFHVLLPLKKHTQGNTLPFGETIQIQLP
jgi:signal transduction histidine kinase